MKKCPFCGEAIQDQAIKCRFCGEWLTYEAGKQQADLVGNNIPGPAVTASQLDSKQSVNELRLTTITLKTNWLWFWTYIRIPLTIFGAIVLPWGTPSLREATQIHWVIALVFCFVLFYGYVAVKLKQRKLIGWKLNWVIIYLEPIIGILDDERSNLGFILGALIWILANSIYFRKRKALFS